DSVGGPSTSQDSRFVVTGCSGGVVYAFDGHGGVWKTRDGGDGAIQEPSVELEITGTTISLSGNICETTFASIGLINHYCEDDTIQLVELVDPTSDLFTSGALSVVSIPPLPRALTEGQKDSILFKWEPSKLFHSDTLITTQIRLRYYSNIYQRVLDTIITVTLHAVGVEPAAIVAPTALNFGSVNYCAPYDTVITIRNLGCDTLFILNGIPASTTGFTMTDLMGNPINFPIALLPGDVTSFDIHLFFTLAGPYANSITFKLQHQGIRRDTVIAISASIDSKGSYVLADSLFAGIISTCNTRDTALPLLNLGCTDIVITSANITGSSAFTLVGSPPYTSPIKPNATGRIFVNFTPPTAGVFDAVLHLAFTTLGEGKTVDIKLHGIGTTDPAFLYIPAYYDTLFDLHLTRCDTSRPFVINLSNPGCPDKVTINSVTMTPASDPNVTISWGNIPYDLFAVTPAFTINALVIPKVVGTYSGKITINYRIGNQMPVDTTIVYFLDVKYGTRYLTLDKDTINLGTIKFCELSDQTLLVRNPGCDSLSVFTYTYTGPVDISMSPSPKKLFASNEQTAINFHLAPVTTGHIVGSLDITSNSDTAAHRIIPVIANVIPTDTVNFDLVANRQDIKVGDTVTFELIPRRTTHGKNITDISFDINCNSDLLELQTDSKHQPQILIPNVTYTLGPPGGTPKHTTQKMTLQGQPFIEIDSGVTIATLTFLARLTDTISTTMSLNNITVNGGDPNFSKCVLGVISSEAGYTLLLECGEKTLMKYMQLGDKLTLQMLSEIIPDPITNRTSYRAAIPLGVGLAGDIEVQIFDATGKLVKSEDVLHAPAKGIYTITIDGVSLPSGAYRYVIKHRETNEEVTGSFRLIR
ncbi:MAG TPA: choice-of-anchor D domain-containing protein, partial [Candidatus Kapabacteria bacterium]|nr:choice-of-anchor D domain-containing protein [Candidatus Kapabacteria bacterium]